MTTKINYVSADGSSYTAPDTTADNSFMFIVGIQSLVNALPNNTALQSAPPQITYQVRQRFYG